MIDSKLAGTGNSRFLKSVSNFKTLYPTYDDFVAALIAGTLPIDLNGINPDGWTQQGTPLNKANLLSDDVANGLGLVDDATPNGAFSAIINAKGKPNGFATLDSSGKVPSGQLPSGAAGGVASLDSNGKVPSSQLNLSSSVSSTSTTTAANSAAVKAAYDKASSIVVTAAVPSVAIENGTIGTNGLRCFRAGNIVLICGAVSQMSCTGSSYGSLIISGIPEPVNTSFYSFRAWGSSGNSEVKQNSVYYQTASSVRLSPDISSDTTQIQITLVYATT